jgi:hypothetical protein
MEHEYSSKIICSFLSPLELLRFRRLSKFHNKCSTEYLIQYYDTTLLQELSCPICGDWIDNEFLNDYNGFYNIFTQSVTETVYNGIINHFNNYGLDVERKSMLCFNCEMNETELPVRGSGDSELYIDSSRYFSRIFSRRGDRKYRLILHRDPVYQWAILYYIRNNEIVWNEFRCVLDHVGGNY